MKNITLLFAASVLVFGSLSTSAHAATGSGACSWHDGVDCDAGSDYDGSVICNDGWRDSRVDYEYVCEDKFIYIDNCYDYYKIIGILEDLKYPKSNDPITQSVIENDIEIAKLKYILTQTNCPISYMGELPIKNNCPYGSLRNGVDGYCKCYLNFFASGLNCLDAFQGCKLTYGVTATWDTGNQTCACMNAQDFIDPKTKQCVSYSSVCKNSMGQNAVWNGSMCTCQTGYFVDVNGQCNTTYFSSVNNTTAPNSMTESNASTKQESDEFIAQQIQKTVTSDDALITKLKGRILLQVQTFGAAWYLNPITLKRYYLKDGATAYEMLRAFGLGINETDYAKIEAGNLALKTRLKGRIILRAQAHGEAYYINPKDLSVTYLKDGEAAYQAMRDLSLGITDTDIAKIPIELFTPLKKEI